MKKMEDNIAIITGGASGFGRETALLFAKEGAKVVIWDINIKGGEETVNLIKKEGGKADFCKVDVRFSDEVKTAVTKVEKLYKKVDILVNNAGVHQFAAGTVVETKVEEYDKVMDTNVKGTFLSAKYLIPLMKASKNGSIINVASAWGQIASNKVPIYCASKAAVIHLTRAMALDHSVDNIRVNCICPGTCRTPLVEKMINLNYSKYGFDTPENMWENRLSAHPLGRLGTSIDVAKLTLFLASGDSSWMTGSIIVIDGGYSLGKAFVKRNI